MGVASLGGVGPIPRAYSGAVPSDPLFRELLASPAVRRLRGIGFLGAPDYSATFCSDQRLPYWRSRLAHSVGVAWAAGTLAREGGTCPAASRLLITAALLHDLGHPPLSHSAETAFIRRFGLDHNTATEAAIRGEGPIGNDIPRILKRHRIAPGDVVELLAGRSAAGPGVDALRNPINVDTVDGILRAARYFLLPHRSRSELVHALATLPDGDYTSLDRFWNLKRQVYAQHIAGPACTRLDQLCADYLMTANIDEGEAFGTDQDLLTRHPELRRELARVDLHAQWSDAPPAPGNTRPRKQYWIREGQRPRALSQLSQRYARA